MKRSLAYVALGVLLALATLVVAPEVTGVPEATGEGDPDGSVTRLLDVLPVVVGVLAFYLLSVGVTEAVRRKRSR